MLTIFAVFNRIRKFNIQNKVMQQNNLILIDKPYASDFIIKTIKENNFQIISTPEARNMISDKSLNWISEEDAKIIFEKNTNIPIYTNSENTIGWIENNLDSPNLIEQIQIFKNKIKFRELLKDSYPDYFFKGIKLKELRNLNADELKFPFIIKPAVGFFSLAVHKIDNRVEWEQVLDKIEYEIEQFRGMYPKEVVDITDFILEEYIKGEEYAIDCYYDENGDPVILNILHHIFSSESDVSDRVYNTSKEIMLEYQNEILDFLKIIGAKTNLKNFPAHVEVRIDSKRNVHPIEINPLRYGGWCTAGDLSWYAYGFNSYEYFIYGKKPDWEEIFKSRKEKIYSMIVLDNNSGIKESDIEYFDYDLLLKDFENPMDLRKVDYNRYSVFGFLFTETSFGNEKELNQILTSDLKRYIKVKKASTNNQ